MTNSKVIIDSLRQLIYKHVHDYEVVDQMEIYLDELYSHTVDLTPQIEVELENILDTCACWDRHSEDNNYGKVFASVERLRGELYGD